MRATGKTAYSFLALIIVSALYVVIAWSSVHAENLENEGPIAAQSDEFGAGENVYVSSAHEFASAESEPATNSDIVIEVENDGEHVDMVFIVSATPNIEASLR